MHLTMRAVTRTFIAVVTATSVATSVAAQPPVAIDSRVADVNGIRLHYLAARKRRRDHDAP